MKSIIMDYKYIKQLLERYWLCETTLDEEAELKRFFTSEKIPDEFISYKKWFSGIDKKTTFSLDRAFDKKILAQLSTKSKSIHPLFSMKSRIRVAILIVLVFTCTISIYEIVSNRQDQQISILSVEDTFSNPEDALVTLFNTLELALNTMDKGIDIVAKDFQQADHIFDIILTP